MPGTGKGRRIRRLLLFTAIAGCLAFVAVWLAGAFDETYDFRAESVLVLNDLTGVGSTDAAGKAAAAKHAYDNASFLFQEASLLTSFVDRADRLTEVLGTFEEIEKVKEVETLDTIRGKTARIVYSVRFSHVTTTAELSYLRGGENRDTWKLLGFTIRVPSFLEGKTQSIDSEYDRIKAPAEVLQLVDETLLAIDEGKGAEIRAQASPPFQQSTTDKGFAISLERHRRELGPFKRRLTIHSSGQNAKKDRARVHVLLQFEKAKTSGNFEFIKTQGTWRLLHLKVLIPEPLFPVRPQQSK